MPDKALVFQGHKLTAVALVFSALVSTRRTRIFIGRKNSVQDGFKVLTVTRSCR